MAPAIPPATGPTMLLLLPVLDVGEAVGAEVLLVVDAAEEVWVVTDLEPVPPGSKASSCLHEYVVRKHDDRVEGDTYVYKA